VTNQFLAVAGVDYLAMVASGGGSGKVLLKWRGEQVEVTVGEPETASMPDNRFRIIWPGLPAGNYELRITGDLAQWRRVFETNVTSGVIEYVDPEPPQSQARFYQLWQMPSRRKTP
jgi:hypothetical protein